MLPSLAPWKQLQNDTKFRRGSQSSRMSRLPFRIRIAIEFGWWSSPPRRSPETRGLMSGPGWQRTNQIPMERNGCNLHAAVPLPGSLTLLKREISEKKRSHGMGRILAFLNTARQQEKPRKPDPVPAKSNKRLAARFYRLKTGHCLTGQCLTWTKNR